jgi:hypothetical protein
MGPSYLTASAVQAEQDHGPRPTPAKVLANPRARCVEAKTQYVSVCHSTSDPAVWAWRSRAIAEWRIWGSDDWGI